MSDAEKIAPQYDKGQRAFEAYVLWRHNAAHSIPVIRRMWEHLSGEERSAWLVAEHDIWHAGYAAAREQAAGVVDDWAALTFPAPEKEAQDIAAAIRKMEPNT